MSRHLTPYGQEQRDRARRAWLLLPFGGLLAVATLIVFGLAGVICPEPPRERRNYQRGYRYHPPGGA